MAELVPTGLFFGEQNERPELHDTIKYDGNNIRRELAFHRGNNAADLELFGVLITNEDRLPPFDYKTFGADSRCQVNVWLVVGNLLVP
jgi:hypothetical protein